MCVSWKSNDSTHCCLMRHRQNIAEPTYRITRWDTRGVTGDGDVSPTIQRSVSYPEANWIREHKVWIGGIKDELISSAKISTGCRKVANLGRECRQMMSRRRHRRAHQQWLGFGISERFSQHGVDITGLTASLLTFPAGLDCHGRSSEHLRACKALRSYCSHRWNLFRGNDLKVRPTEWIAQFHNPPWECEIFA